MTRTAPTDHALDAKTREMIRGWFGCAPLTDAAAQERVARWMRDSLRAGGIRECRALVRAAVASEVA